VLCWLWPEVGLLTFVLPLSDDVSAIGNWCFCCGDVFCERGRWEGGIVVILFMFPIKHVVSIYVAAGAHGCCWLGCWISLHGLLCSFEYQGVSKMK